MDPSEAIGRRRLNDTMRQFSDAINSGIVADIETTSGLGRAKVTSLRRCDSDVAGCSNASIVAEPSTNDAMTSSASNDAMTSSTCRTVAKLICLCFLSLYLNRLRFTDKRTSSLTSDSRNERKYEYAQRYDVRLYQTSPVLTHQSRLT